MKGYEINRSEFVSSSEWSISNALHMMKLSYAVYAGTTDNIGAKEDWSITEKLVFDAGYDLRKIEARKGIYEPNAMVCSDDSNVFLIFRGTEPTSWNQWATDAKTLRTTFCIGRVHRGFLSAVNLVWEEIIECLDAVDPGKQKHLFVGGHSLGAGMSQVASSKLAFMENDRHPAAVYNFGCPRALNSDGASQYNDVLGTRTFRVVNNNDVVCRVPFRTMGFSHIGELKYLTSDRKVLDDFSKVQLLKEGLHGRFRELAELNVLDFATDHLPQEYTQNLVLLGDDSVGL